MAQSGRERGSAPGPQRKEGRTEGRTGRVIMPQDKQAGESGARLSRQANQNGGSKRKKERIGGDCYPYRKSHRRG